MTLDPKPEVNSEQPVKIHANYLSIYDATWAGYPGIVFWGGVYGMAWPIVLGVVSFFAGLYSEYPFGLLEIGQGLAIWLVSVVILGFVGMMLAGLVGLFVTFCICLFNKSMGFIWTPITAISIAGGMTGFLCCFALAIGPLTQGHIVFGVLGYLLGPFLAMIMGQVGAVRMSSDQIAAHYSRQKTRVRKLWDGEITPSLTKFDLRQMLALTGWFAFVFAILSTVGRVSLVASLVIASYFFIQVAVFYLVELMLSSYVQRKLNLVLLSESAE